MARNDFGRRTPAFPILATLSGIPCSDFDFSQPAGLVLQSFHDLLAVIDRQAYLASRIRVQVCDGTGLDDVA
jgi:hypothetical protein